MATAWLVGTSLVSHAQAPALRSLAGTYRYTGYTVFDAESPNEPTAVQGVGGTLLLRPDGTYAKRLTITLGTRTVPFNQDGTYRQAGDSIRFAFHDQKGADVQRGTARLDSAGRGLTLTILGYPAGNKGVYELEAAPAAPAMLPTPKASPASPAKAGKKRWR
ncbi:hypothetical protein GCM10027594_30350 [Hymenobacter agri]